MAEPFVGQIIAVGFDFAPAGWLPCDGRSVAIADYNVLYSLIGTLYGGDGQRSFALPDLRGRAGIGLGRRSGSSYHLGESVGSDEVTLSTSQVAAHSHTLLASAKLGTDAKPGQDMALAVNPQTAAFLYQPPPADTSLSGASISIASGGGQPHENRQPFLTINYIICYAGVYPSSS